MGAVTAGVIAAGALAAGATAYAGSQQASATRRAADANRDSMRDTNALNYRMFLESRGADGSAVLPLFATTPDGRPLEPELFRDALAVYDATGSVSPDQRIQDFTAIQRRLQPLQQGAERTAAGIFSGDLAAQSMAALEPVSEAREGAVEARRQAGLEALNETLNEIRAIQSARGFTGSGSAGRMMEFDARRRIGQSAAADLGQARIQTAEDRRGITEQDINRRLASMDLAPGMTRQAIGLTTMPQEQAQRFQLNRMGVFDPFRIGTGQFQHQPLPQIPATASTGQIAGQAAAEGFGSIGNFLAAQEIARINAGT